MFFYREIVFFLAIALVAQSHADTQKQVDNLEDLFNLTLAELVTIAVVTAQKRPESILDVPMSITAFSGDDLARRGLNDVGELAMSVPNLSMRAINISSNVGILIRGIGSSGNNKGIEASVGTFIDGLYMPAAAQMLGELTDIASFEVLRGPQGTLYGRNTPVGALNVTTKKPTDEYEAKVSVGYGSYDEAWTNGYVGGGLSNNTAGRLSFWYRDRDGYQDNLFTGDDINDSNTWGLRGRLVFEPTESFSIGLIASYSEIENRCCMGEQIDALGEFGIATPGFLAGQEAAGLPFNNFDDSDHKVDGDEEPLDQTESTTLSMQVDWQVGDGIVLTSITGYQNWDNDSALSTDALKNNLVDVFEEQENHIYSQELRITSPAGEKFDYLAGLYLYRQETTWGEQAIIGTDANRVFPAPIPPCADPCTLPAGDSVNGFLDQETQSVAVYGNLTWHLTDQWDVTAGLRLGRDQKEAFISHTNAPGNSWLMDNVIFGPNEVGDVDLDDDSFTWSANSRYRLDEDVMLFATVSTGYKSGGFNARRLSPGAPVKFANEDSVSYEAGIKSTWLERSLLLSATVYHTTVKELQESTLGPSGTGFIVGNAGEREAVGFESEVTWRPVASLAISGSLAYLDAEYTDYTSARCGVGEAPEPGSTACDRTGDTPAFSPEWQYTLGLEWQHSISDSGLELSLRADYSWVDEQNLARVSLDSYGEHDSYGLLNLRAVLTSNTGAWQVEAFVKNAGDESYFTGILGQPVGAFASGGGTAGASGGFGWYGAPRTLGLQISWYPSN
jgi:iron complex outermembrane receptor protein